MIRRSTRIAAVAGLMALTNCSEGPTEPKPPEEKPLEPTEIRPYLFLPAGTPAVGSNVTITFSVKRGTSAPKVGSFGATISYDATAVEFVGGVTTSDGLVAVNSTAAGTMDVAGASAEGFGSDALASATIKLLKANGLTTLSASVSELTSSDLEDKKGAASRVMIRSAAFDR